MNRKHQSAIESYGLSVAHICQCWRVKVCRPDYFGQELEHLLKMINESIRHKQDLRRDVSELKKAREDVAFLLMLGSKIVIEQYITKKWLAPRPVNLYMDFR